MNSLFLSIIIIICKDGPVMCIYRFTGLILINIHENITNYKKSFFFLFQTSDVIKLAKPMLDCWFESSTSYVSHCVHRLGCDIKYLIHAVSGENMI